MEQSQYSRFKDAPWFPKEHKERVLVAGAGGIGSWLTLLLARAGFDVTVVDFDTLEEHNLGGQLFRRSDIGDLKIRALYNSIKEYSGDDINTLNTTVDRTFHTSKFTFAAFDNMKARRDLFDSWKRTITSSTPYAPIFIDGRLTFEQIQIFCVTPDRIEEYEKYLFADSDVEDAPCTMKQTSHTACMIAALMTSFFTNHITNLYEMEFVREVPFFHEYFVPLNLTNDVAV